MARWRWRNPAGEPCTIASRDLQTDDVPPPLLAGDDHEGVQLVIEFAHTFHGYDWAGSLEQLADIVRRIDAGWRAGRGLPVDLDTLRGCLFFWVRSHRFAGGYDPGPSELVWINALLEGIRAAARGQHRP